MNSASDAILLNFLSELQVEYQTYENTIRQNENRISEIEEYIQSFLSKEDSSFKLLSPRNVESVHKEEFERLRRESETLAERNAVDQKRLSHLKTQIDQIEDVIRMEKDADTNRNLSNYAIINIQEKERSRIARDLHDTSLQNLAYLIQKIELCGKFIEQDPIRAKLELSVVSKNLRNVIDDIRGTIFNLRPMTFDDLGLQSAFERLLDSVNENGQYVMDVDIEDVSCENDLILITLYRIVQECLANIVKHAEADRILLHCRFLNDYYHITIEDNGKGFFESEIPDAQERHFGLTLLKERVELLDGTLEIKSMKGKGTRIHIDIPVKDMIQRKKDMI